MNQQPTKGIKGIVHLSALAPVDTTLFPLTLDRAEQTAVVVKRMKEDLLHAIKSKANSLTTSDIEWHDVNIPKIQNVPDHDCHASSEDGCEGCGRREV